MSCNQIYDWQKQVGSGPPEPPPMLRLSWFCEYPKQNNDMTSLSSFLFNTHMHLAILKSYLSFLSVLFKDEKMAAAILKEESPVKQKRCGRQVKNFDDAVWKSKAEDIVKKANRAKVCTNLYINYIVMIFSQY